MNNNFAKFGIYMRFLCRRERVMSPVWLVCLAGLSALFAAFYPELLPTQTEIAQMAATMTNPAMVAMMGNVYGMENLTQASVMAQECLIWFLLTAAVMNIFLINRHTRADEELGRLEMFRSLSVGKLTGSAAAITFSFIVNTLVSVLTAVLLLIVNIGGTTISGAFSFGFAVGMTGFMFAGLTIFAAQLFQTARGVSGACLGLLGLFYVLRGLGDVRGNALSYISPLGLGLKVEAFYSNSITPIIILLTEGVLLSAAALAVCSVRNHGMGILPAKKGKSRASKFLLSPFGLAWRLSRGAGIGWGIALLLLGASYGSVCADINSFVESNEMMQKVIGGGAADMLLDNYVAMIFAMMSMVASIPIVLTATRVHGEEKRGRLEQLLARNLSRMKLYTSFIAIALIESAAMVALLAVGLFAASGSKLELAPLLKAGLNYLPAIWTMAGIAILLVGLLPKLTAVVWAFFGHSFFVMYFGRIMNVPEWAAKISPFGNIPQLPVQEFSALPLCALTLAAAALSAVGLLGFLRRDIA